MPNWAEGNIRLRGKRENIIHFLQEELKGIYELRGNETEERPIMLEPNCGGNELILRKDPDTSNFVYFCGSNRQFIDFDGEDEISAEFSNDTKHQREDNVLYIPNFNGAWSIDTEFFRQKAMQYKIDIRVFVWEMGMEWSSVATWYRTGETDESHRKYADWLWDSSMPYLGG